VSLLRRLDNSRPDIGGHALRQDESEPIDELQVLSVGPSGKLAIRVLSRTATAFTLPADASARTSIGEMVCRLIAPAANSWSAGAPFWLGRADGRIDRRDRARGNRKIRKRI
jgi:hypothetical protein